MTFLYLTVLIIVIGCLTLVDRRYKLAYFDQPRRTSLTLIAGVGIFSIWDLLGIGFGIFFHGASPYTLPLRLAPQFPLEEVFFLYVLCYTTLLLHRFGARRWPRT